MKVAKVIQAGVVHLTNIKKQLLDAEYNHLQAYLKEGKDLGLYSANKQQAKRFYKKIKSDKEYPLSIRRDLIRIERRDTTVAKYWARIPVKNRRGGVWVAIKPPCVIREEYEICESKLIRRNERYFLHITIQKEVEIQYPANNIAVIACDLGERNPIASVELLDDSMIPRFYGDGSIRATRAHYSNLRKSIGKAKVKHGVQVIKRIGSRESRFVRDANHKISRNLVDKAIELRDRGYEPIIVLGKLKRIRKQRSKGQTRCRKNNRKIHSWAFSQLTQMVTYKANWEGIPVETVSESWTSQTCHRCGAIGERSKRLFVCEACGLEYNADLNGAINIGNRFLDHWFKDRAPVNVPLTPTVSNIVKSELMEIQSSMGEATLLVGW